MKLNMMIRLTMIGSSRPARGGWIEIAVGELLDVFRESRPARGGWIEIPAGHTDRRGTAVSPREGRVD